DQESSRFLALPVSKQERQAVVSNRLPACSVRLSLEEPVKSETSRLSPNTNFDGANFDHQNLSNQDGSGSSFINASFVGPTLTNTHLTNANLTHAHVAGANLTNVNFDNAILSFATLSTLPVIQGATVTVEADTTVHSKGAASVAAGGTLHVLGGLD